MRFRPVILTLSAVLMLCSIACKHQPAPGESVAEVCQPGNHDKTVSVSGYLATSSFILCGETCQLSIRQNKKDKDPHVTINVRVGDGNDQVAKLAESFKPGDLSVKDHQGATLGYLDVARVTGQVNSRGDADTCQISRIEKIEKLATTWVR